MTKTRIELKREYWSKDPYINEGIINLIVDEYGEKPATSGEAFYVVSYHIRELAETGMKAVMKVCERLWGKIT